jgi:hypothetical protein
VARKLASEKGPGKEVLPTPSRRQYGERRRVQRRVRGESRLIPSRPHGEKSAYVKVTVTLPPELYGLIMKETTKRKLAKEAQPKGPSLSLAEGSLNSHASCPKNWTRASLTTADTCGLGSSHHVGLIWILGVFLARSLSASPPLAGSITARTHGLGIAGCQLLGQASGASPGAG